MEKVYVSDAGPKVSPAIYGFYRWDEIIEAGISKMEQIVNLCLELGINTFDHADSYGAFQCEKL
jgi:predicted oxidoreductase